MGWLFPWHWLHRQSRTIVVASLIPSQSPCCLDHAGRSLLIIAAIWFPSTRAHRRGFCCLVGGLSLALRPSPSRALRQQWDSWGCRLVVLMATAHGAAHAVAALMQTACRRAGETGHAGLVAQPWLGSEFTRWRWRNGGHRAALVYEWLALNLLRRLLNLDWCGQPPCREWRVAPVPLTNTAARLSSFEELARPLR